ncbi:MAG: hypothetical protein CM1200mP18_09510 [Gammaproteobacteria bacterium]|nr:MAG: hypothetical protein CM1200mP18_09510 [Gammaproteobacteria bacterium]
MFFDSVDVPGLFKEVRVISKSSVLWVIYPKGRRLEVSLIEMILRCFTWLLLSGGGEKDFDLAMRVNLDGGRHVLEALRARESQPRLVFASSIAGFGGSRMPDVVGDHVKQTPRRLRGNEDHGRVNDQ